MDSVAVSRQGYGTEDPPPEPSAAAATDPSPPASPPVAANPGETSELETPSEAVSDDDNSEEEEPREDSPKRQKTSQNEDCEQEPKSPDSAPSAAPGDLPNGPNQSLKASTSKKKKKSSNIWVSKTVNRKGKKKGKSGNGGGHAAAVAPEDIMTIVPAPRLFPDKNDDNAEMQICLSRVFKAEKVEVSDDRMSAMSSKGYRMIRATRGVLQGAWYFEIKVVRLGETGHTRLGWSTEKGDLQAPVGYDANSYGYRDIDGSKIHKALREKYADEGYKEGDVIGFYINLPDGELYAPKPPVLVLYKGKRYMSAPDNKDDQPKVIPGSEISFFRNGVCQGVAFTDLLGGRYYPAASMYTMPNQPDCEVRFNFGPDFDFFPSDFDGRPIPHPMVEAPYHGVDSGVENAAAQEILPKKSSTRMIEA